MGSPGPRGQAYSSLLWARPGLLLWVNLGKQGRENNVCQLQNKPIRKGMLLPVLANKEGENLSLTSGPSYAP